ncbi:acetone carboxylase [Nocardioides sp. CPCC 205120]|uniref:acetone carboxylase n=1 Tax=Nocardioides sp. CPCC 205120 TaxID=3406462 RepID=UPI003B512357
MSAPATCSARGCRAEATWALRWNNPRLHTPERRKIWLACDDHRASLSDFLGARDFLRDVVPAAEVVTDDDEPDDRAGD